MTDRRLRIAAAAVGVAAVVQSAALFFAPDPVGSVLPVVAIAETTTLSAAGVRALAFGLVGAGCLLWVASSSGRVRGDDGPPEPEFPTLEAAAPDDSGTAVGSGFDRNVRETLESVAEGTERDAVRADLRSLAVDVVAHADGCPRQTARRRVADGEWTDDRVAAGYLASEAVLPLHRRLLARLRPRVSRRRRIERTVVAIEARLDRRGRPR